MLRIALIPLLLIGLLAGAVVWSGQGKQDRADFAFVLKGDHVTLDLNNMSYGIDIRLASSMWEGLYTLDPTTFQPILGAADKVDLSPDQRVYTFHIRPAARWSNGDRVTAGDFLFEWRRMLESPKEYTYLHTQYIKGAAAYRDAYADYAAAPIGHKPAKPDFATVGERAIGDDVFQVEVANPVAFMPAMMAFCPFYPMHERSMRPFAQTDDKTGQVTYDPRFTQPPNLITNGPFKLAFWAFKRRIRLEANPCYWDRANVRIRTVDEVRADDGLAAYRLYEQGDVDLLLAVDADIAAPLFEAKRPDLKVHAGFGTAYYELNCMPTLPDGRKNPLADVRVRRALSMAIDKLPLVRDVARMSQKVATDFIPPGVFDGYVSPAGLPFDVPRARQLLAEAGFPNGNGFPRLSITFPSETSAFADMATVIRRQWSNNLGIDVDPDGMERKQASSNLNHQKFSIGHAAWYGDYMDVSTFTDKYLSGGDNNAAKWVDPQYDDLCNAAAREGDPVKRMQLFHDAEARLLDAAPIIPLYTDVNTYLYRSSVHGITPNYQAATLFKSIWTDRATGGGLTQ